jgi:hypothetical protein
MHAKCLLVSKQSQQIVELSGNSHVLFTLRKELRLAEQSTVAMSLLTYSMEQSPP